MCLPSGGSTKPPAPPAPRRDPETIGVDARAAERRRAAGRSGRRSTMITGNQLGSANTAGRTLLGG